MLPMRVYLHCKKRDCDRKQLLHKKQIEALATSLGKQAEQITIRDIEANAARFMCSKCKQKGVWVHTEPRPTPSVTPVTYVGSGRDPFANRVFHRDSCGWVGHMYESNRIVFPSREHAYQSGFDPCRY